MYEVIATTFNKVYNKLEHMVDYQTNFRLSVAQFLIIASFTQVHLDYVLHFYNFMCGSHPGVIFVAYVFLQIVITIPYNTFLLFLSSYSQSQFIKIWNCIPLFKGVGYTMMVARNVLVLLNQIYATNLLFLLFHTIVDYEAYSRHDGAWRTCGFAAATNSCLPVGATACQDDRQYEMSAIQYLRLALIEGVGDNRIYLFTVNIVLWILSVPLVFIGLKRFVRAYVFVVLVCLSMFLLVFITFSVRAPVVGDGLKRVLDRIVRKQHMDVKEMSFWTLLLIFVTSSIETGDLIWLGAQMPTGLKPPVAAAAIAVFKILGLALFNLLFKYVLGIYLTANPIIERCNMKITSFMVVFQVVLDILYTFDQSHIWVVLYCVSLSVYCFMNNCMMYMATVDSITDEYPNVKKHRMFICFMFALVNCVLSVGLISPYGEIILIIWNNYEGVMLGLIFYFLWSVLLNYVYSRDMLITDYVFSYGEVPASTVVVSWSACPVLALLLTSSTCFWLIFEEEVVPFGKVSCFSATFVVFSPAFASTIWTFVKALYNVNARPDYPNALWGPPSPEGRLARERMVPRRDICYRHDSVTCKHLCLIKIPEFEEERLRQRTKFHEATRLILQDDVFRPVVHRRQSGTSSGTISSSTGID